MKKVFLLLSVLFFISALVLAESSVFDKINYDNPTQKDVQLFVREALSYAKNNGKEAALKEFMNKNGRFIKGELYIYAYDFDGVNIAHGEKPQLVGKNLINLKDPNGVLLIQELIKKAKLKDGGWVQYMWAHPLKEKNWPKLGYVEKVDDTWWLGSGMYKNDSNTASFK